MFSTIRAKQPGAPLSKVLFYEFAAWVVRVVSRLFYRAKVFDVGMVPARGPVLLAANHQSMLDPPLISVRVRQRHLNFIAKSGLFTFKPFATLLTWLNALPIRDDAGDTAAIKETLARLERGWAVLIFPEGSRTLDGAIAPYKRGVALLVKKAKCPVVPVAIEGAFEAWPAQRRFPHLFGCRVYVKYGHPIDHADLMQNGPDAALERLRHETERLREELCLLLGRKRPAKTPP